MKRNIEIKKTVFVFVAMIFATLFSGCYTPSPFYGSWSDNLGNKMQFNDDGTYTAQIIVNSEQKQYNGNYSVAENVLTLSSDETIVTEWDIRGSILYLQWTAKVEGGDTVTKDLALYHN